MRSQGHSQIHTEFEVSLSYMALCCGSRKMARWVEALVTQAGGHGFESQTLQKSQTKQCKHLQSQHSCVEIGGRSLWAS